MGRADGDWGGWEVCSKSRQAGGDHLLAPRPSSARQILPVCWAWGSTGRNQAWLWSHGAHGPGGGCGHLAELVLCSVMQDTQAHVLDQSWDPEVWEPQVPSVQPKTQAPLSPQTGAPKVPLGRMRRRMDAR